MNELKQLRLTNFRQHESKVVNFTDGFNVVRGRNEAGKSSLLEAIAYAMFGSRALRETIDNVVTWGQKPNDLKVELCVGEVTVSRSPRGAEITGMGQVLVTGQTEVTRWCEQNIIGCDCTTAMNLMFANQTALRGVLQSGPKATACLIEDLGDFDLFNRLLDAAQRELPLGSASLQEARLRDLFGDKERLVAVEEPDEAKLQSDLELLNQKMSAVEAEEAKIKTARQVALETSTRYSEAQTRFNALADENAAIEQNMVGLRAKLQNLPYANQPQIDMQGLHKQLNDATNHVAVLKAFEKFSSLGQYSSGDRAQFMSRMTDVQNELRKARNDISTLDREIAVCESRLVTSSVCGMCGQDVSQFPEVVLKNSALQSEIAEKEHDLAQKSAHVAALEDELKVSQNIVKLDNNLATSMASIGNWLQIENTVIPRQYTWSGPEVSSVTHDIDGLKNTIAVTEQTNKRIVEDTATFKVLSEQQHSMFTRQMEINDELTKIALPTKEQLEELSTELQKLELASIASQTNTMAIALERESLLTNFRTAKAAFTAYLEDVVTIDKQIEKTKDEIEQLSFNNALVKRIRAARPIVGNKLWSIVLSSVSTIFSQMRNEKSVVTRTDEGFLINGRAATSYSGSTLDILGLAVRTALVKTFIPTCGFLILDEPGAACDDDRVGSMLGYIAGSGFKQTLLVTHEDVSESVASNLIEL